MTNPTLPKRDSGSSIGETALPWAEALATALCAVFGLIGWRLGENPAAIAFFLAAYLSGGLGPTVSAVRALARGRLDVDLLMIVAALGAAWLGDWAEGTALLFLFSLSETLEDYALYRTTRSIGALVRLRPREAGRVDEEGRESVVSLEALAPGDVVRVRPGEAFPVDGQVIEGRSWADEATITGESRPVAKDVGDLVFAGTMNGRGSVLVRMTRAVADSTLERIIALVREAQSAKTATQQRIEAWRPWYVVSVFAASAVTFLVLRFVLKQPGSEAFYRAMVLLVVSSPCAVVVGTPAAMLAALARAARHGVLFKGAGPLDALGRVDTIAFDKTGTVTFGTPRVVAVEAFEGMPPDRLLALAAAVEQASEHPLAQAVVDEARQRGLDVPSVRGFESRTGLGVRAEIDGVGSVGVGREGLFGSGAATIRPEIVDSLRRQREDGRTVLLVGLGAPDRVVGLVAVADQVRPDAATAFAALKRLGVRRLVILTGDHPDVARAVAQTVGADEVLAGLLPQEKVDEIRRLRSLTPGRSLAMIGDGVNDAPALAAADVGVAMGGAGTDVALEVADVVLMRDDLSALPLAVWLGRRVRRRVFENLIFAFSVIGVLAVGTFIDLPLWLGVLGHEGSTLVVVLNGLRLLGEPIPDLGSDRRVPGPGLEETPQPETALLTP